MGLPPPKKKKKKTIGFQAIALNGPKRMSNPLIQTWISLIELNKLKPWGEWEFLFERIGKPGDCSRPDEQDVEIKRTD